MRELSDEMIYNTPKILIMAIAEEIVRKAEEERKKGLFRGYTWNEGRIVSYAKRLKG